MKTNEAPEKLYIDSREHWRKSWTAFTTKAKGDDIEYTRTDALIEKAENFFVKKFEIEDYIDTIDIDGSPIYNYIRIIEDFKNYMKG